MGFTVRPSCQALSARTRNASASEPSSSPLHVPSFYHPRYACSRRLFRGDAGHRPLFSAAEPVGRGVYGGQPEPARVVVRTLDPRGLRQQYQFSRLPGQSIRSQLESVRLQPLAADRDLDRRELVHAFLPAQRPCVGLLALGGALWFLGADLCKLMLHPDANRAGRHDHLPHGAAAKCATGLGPALGDRVHHGAHDDLCVSRRYCRRHLGGRVSDRGLGGRGDCLRGPVGARSARWSGATPRNRLCKRQIQPRQLRPRVVEAHVLGRIDLRLYHASPEFRRRSELYPALPRRLLGSGGAPEHLDGRPALYSALRAVLFHRNGAVRILHRAPGGTRPGLRRSGEIRFRLSVLHRDRAAIRCDRPVDCRDLCRGDGQRGQ